MADKIFDYGDDTLKEGSVNEDSGLTALSALISRAHQMSIEVARAEDQLKHLKESEVDLVQRRIPDLMDELSMSSFTTKSNLKVTVKKQVRAKFTDATRVAAAQWFTDQNLERMVKNEFTLKLDKGQDEKASDLCRAIEGLGLPYTNKKNVHHSALSAFVKQRDAAGENVPDELFNVYRFSVAKIG